MKKKFIHTLLFILAVLFMIHTATLYAQVSVVRKEKGFEVKDSLIVNQSFDRERKVLTLEIKNGFDNKVMLSNPHTSLPFLLNYITEEGKKESLPHPLGLSDTARVIWLKSDSSWVVNYKWDHYLKSNTKQISLWGKLVYSVFDENDHSQGIFLQYIEEKYFDYR